MGSMRASYSGNTSASQAEADSSILFARSIICVVVAVNFQALLLQTTDAGSVPNIGAIGFTGGHRYGIQIVTPAMRLRDRVSQKADVGYLQPRFAAPSDRSPSEILIRITRSNLVIVLSADTTSRREFRVTPKRVPGVEVLNPDRVSMFSPNSRQKRFPHHPKPRRPGDNRFEFLYRNRGGVIPVSPNFHRSRPFTSRFRWKNHWLSDVLPDSFGFPDSDDPIDPGN